MGKWLLVNQWARWAEVTAARPWRTGSRGGADHGGGLDLPGFGNLAGLVSCKSSLSVRLLLSSVLCLGGVLVSPWAYAGLQDGLVAYYPFNGNANDESGNNHNGIVNNAALTFDKTGKANSAYNFNGINSYISVNDASDLRATNKVAAISLFIKPLSNTGTPFSVSTILRKGVSCNVPGWSIEIGDPLTFNTPISFMGWDGWNVSWNINRPENFIQGQWYHVVMVVDGQAATVYVNGKSIGTSSINNSINVDNDSSMAIGAAPPGACGRFHSFYKGDIDELRLYNRALSDTEVTELYQQGTPPEVTSISPTQAVIGKETVFEVRGHNLHPNMGFTVADCQYSNTALMGGTSELQRFVCTQFGKAGKKRGLIKTKPGGELLPYNFTVKAVKELDPNPTATVTGSIKLGSQVGNGIVLSNHDNSRRCVTDNQGAFRCEVPQGWSGTLIPQAKGVKFTPALLAVDNATGEMPKPPILGISTDTFPLDGIKPRDWKDVVGNAPWRIVAADGEPDDASSYEGRFALRSAKIQANQSSVVETAITVNQDSEVRFARRVSSHAGHGVLRFAIDGQEQGAWSGELPWQTVSFPITAGAHRLRWMYQKDAEIGQGLDAAWLDAVSYASTVPTRLPGQTVKAECEGATAGTLNLMTVRNPTCEQVQAYLVWLKNLRSANLSNANSFVNAVKGIDVAHEVIEQTIEIGSKMYGYIYSPGSKIIKKGTPEEIAKDIGSSLFGDYTGLACKLLTDEAYDETCDAFNTATSVAIEFGIAQAAAIDAGTPLAVIKNAAALEPIAVAYGIEKGLGFAVNVAGSLSLNVITEQINSVNIADDFLDEYYKGGMNFAAMRAKYGVTSTQLNVLVDAVANSKGYYNSYIWGDDYLNLTVQSYITAVIAKNKELRDIKKAREVLL